MIPYINKLHINPRVTHCRHVGTRLRGLGEGGGLRTQRVGLHIEALKAHGTLAGGPVPV